MKLKCVFGRILVMGWVLVQAGAVRADGVRDVVVDPVNGLAITTPGSYRLVSDVVMTANAIAFNIVTPDVTLDLNGHTVTASADSTVAGVLTGQSRIVVQNGTFKNFGGSGVSLQGNDSRISRVTVESCNDNGGSVGLAVGFNSIVEDCIVRNNIPESTGGTIGIYAEARCIIRGNVVVNNDSINASSGTYGIYTGDGCLVVDNILNDNTALSGTGLLIAIRVGNRSTVTGNNVTNNDHLGSGGVVGINTGSYCLIQGNVVSEHDTSATTTGSVIGISEGGGGKVFDNVCSDNDAAAGGNGSAYGIKAGSAAEIRGNSCYGQNAQGTGVAAGIWADNGNNFVIQNYCAGNIGGARSHGIYVTGPGTLVSGNYCVGNGTAGLIFTSSLDNRAENNRFRQTTGIDTTNGVNPESLGAGDLANLTY